MKSQLSTSLKHSVTHPLTQSIAVHHARTWCTNSSSDISTTSPDSLRSSVQAFPTASSLLPPLVLELSLSLLLGSALVVVLVEVASVFVLVLEDIFVLLVDSAAIPSVANDACPDVIVDAADVVWRSTAAWAEGVWRERSGGM